MLREMNQYQLNHHPIAAALLLIFVAPFLLAAILLYMVVFVAVQVFLLLFGSKR